MSNATASSSSSSTSSGQLSRGPSPVSTVSGEGCYGENITYQHGLHPNPYQLLHIFNTGQYDDQLVVNQLRQRTDGNGYPCPDINDTRSLLTRLTSEPRTLKNQLSPRNTAAPSTTTEPPAKDTLIYPDPSPYPNVKPKIEPTDHSPARDLEPPTTTDPRNLQTPEASVPLRGRRNPHSWRGGPVQRGRG
ncbi:hypothetical protein Moror_15397 [Moniliophthora roreri MCA 2997]|uniref:Uncharacterized protein n=2 Tax=Moniliophthora roreri TaxID=221103 RepID=V2W550_MONRO|nr:hypothetical protein Moror_15397 [Moniliophthora roreri MCA 2997]